MILRDPAYLLHLRSQPCIITGQYGDEYHSVVAAHIGTAGKGIKAPDNWALPMLNSVHQECHNKGEISTIMARASDELIRAVVKANRNVSDDVPTADLRRYMPRSDFRVALRAYAEQYYITEGKERE